MKKRLFTQSTAGEEHVGGRQAQSGAQNRQFTFSDMPDSRAVSLAQLQQQEMASLSTQAAQLRAQAKLMADGGGDACAQRLADKELLQGRFAVAQVKEDEELLQGNFAPVQRMEETELQQGEFAQAAAPVHREQLPSNTGMPGQLKSGVESLSGMSMDHVKVHYNSDKPAQLNARAYAQGSEIHVGSGQEQHLPHEAWHVVQQMQGRVEPTAAVGGIAVNDNAALESEATSMGAAALQLITGSAQVPKQEEKPTGLSASSAVLQAHWITDPDQPLPDMFKWDAPLRGRQWFYNAAANKYRYIIVDEAALNFGDLGEPFGIENSEDRPSLINAVKKQEGKDLLVFFYWSDVDHTSLKQFDPKNHMQPLTDTVSQRCIDYIFKDDITSLDKAVSAEFGSDGVQIHGAMSAASLATTFKNQLNATDLKKTGDLLGNSTDIYGNGDAGYKVSLSEAPKLQLRHVLRLALWSAMGHEVAELNVKGKLGDNDTVLNPGAPITIGKMEVRFTRRVQAESREQCVADTEKFKALVLALTADSLKDVVKKEMISTFRLALDEKDKGTGRSPKASNLDVASEIGKSPDLTEEKLTKYCAATVRRWRALLNSRVLVVFDAAGFKSVSGKTPTLAGASPKNLMNEDALAEQGLPESAQILINADSPENIITMAHELAHVIGFNPTGVEASGHFTDATLYKDAEDEYGPKLLFDAYYFEVLFRRLAEK